MEDSAAAAAYFFTGAAAGVAEAPGLGGAGVEAGGAAAGAACPAAVMAMPKTRAQLTT